MQRKPDSYAAAAKGALFLLLCFVPFAMAYAAPDFDLVAPVQSGFQQFLVRVGALVEGAVTSAAFQTPVNMLWLSFAVFLIIETARKYALGSVVIWEFFSVAILLLFSRVFMSMYSTLTDGIWNFFLGAALVLQKEMIGTDNMFFAPEFIVKLVRSIQFPDVFSISELFNSVKLGFGLVIISIATMLLSAIAYFVVVYGTWGVAIAKLIGLLFIPTLLLERTSFLFDGWLRFFLGFCVYGLIAQLNIVMVAVAMALYFGFALPPSTTAISPTIIPSITEVSELFGLFTFLLVGIFSLFSTGRFASTVLSGAGGGGLGNAMMSGARSVTQVVRGIK